MTVVKEDSGSGAAMVILALVVAALIGLGVYFFSTHGTTSVSNTTIEAPAAPSLPAAPSAPAGSAQ